MIHCVLQNGQSVQVVPRNQVTDVSVDENFPGTTLSLYVEYKFKQELKMF